MTNRGPLYLAAAIAVLVLSVGGPAAAQPEAPVPENIQVSREGDTTGARRPVTDFSEVHLAVDPTDPEHLLGSSKFFHTPETYGFYTGVFESHNGGRTWSQEQPPGVESYSLTSDPVNAFDASGNGYFTLLTRGPTGLDMLKKPRDRDWERPVVVDRTTVTDKQWIAADQNSDGASPYKDNVYMSWTAVGDGIVFARSTDGNRTWRPFVTLTTGDVQGSITAVGPDGTVYVAWGRRIFGGPAEGTMQVTASSNGGASFAAPATAAEITSVPFFLPNGLPGVNFRSPASLPAFAVSPTNGFLYLAWADYRNGDADIYLARSTDGYRDWGEPVRLNDDPLSNGADQIHPQIAVAPNGRVAVMWMDRRLDCPAEEWIAPDNQGKSNFCLTAFMTRSTDDGESWQPNFQVGASPWDWSLNLPIASQGSPDTGFIGDYQGLASSNEYDYPFWAATNDLGDNPDHRQQVWVARVDANIDYPPPGPVTPVASATASATLPATATATGTSATATATGTSATAPPTGTSATATATGTSATAPASPTPTSGGDPGTPTTTPTGSPTPRPAPAFLPHTKNGG